MKPYRQIVTVIACALFGGVVLPAKAIPEIAGLQQAAADFVVAYNARDAAALAELFTEDGEITNLTVSDLTTGRDQIQARYEEIFEGEPFHIAIEVDSIRLVAPRLAIEDGVYHLTPADDESAPPRSTKFTAVLTSDDAGVWRIASSRSLTEVTESAGRLATLADALKGEWTYRGPDGVLLDLAFGWDATGKFLAGVMLTTTADGAPQEGSIRIGWDSSKQQIVSWMFDATGGFTHGVWTPINEGWLIRSDGTTGDGETFTASQQLTNNGPDTLIWAATHRIVDGENVPDVTLRLVRQAPEPGNR